LGLGECRELPRRGPSGAPAARDFFVHTDKISANFWPPMRKHTAAEMGKSGQIRDTKPKTGQMGVPGELRLLPGYVVKNPGWMVTLCTEKLL